MSSEPEPLHADQDILGSNLRGLQVALHQVIKQTETGECTDKAHAKLEKEVRMMYRNVQMYRDQDGIKEIWDDYEIDAIPKLCARRVEVDHGVGHFGIDRGTEIKIERAPLDYLIQWATAFREIFAKLELTTPVNEGTDVADADYSDIV
jgi:hypothetical protein